MTNLRVAVDPSRVHSLVGDILDPVDVCSNILYLGSR